MNILFLTNKLPYPPIDGGSIATLNMITGLRDAGNKVTCLSINTSKHSFPMEKIPLELRASVRFLAVDGDTAVRPVPMLANLLFTRQPYIARRFLLNNYARLLDQLLLDSSFDLVQLEGPYLGYYIRHIRDRSRARISLRAHNLEHRIWMRKASNESNPFRRWYLKNMAKRLKRLELKVISQSDFLIPISRVDEEFFRAAGARIPMLTVPAGLVMDQYHYTSLPGDHTLFFIGALDWLPNQEGLEWFLQEVFPLALQRLPSLRFHVAGRNAPDHFIKKLNHPRITYHGEVESGTRFIEAYRVMVAPLLTGSGIRIKILEGMAMGRPVVTTPVGIEGIGARESVEVLVAEEPSRFADQLVTLLTDDEVTVPIATAGRQFVTKNFDTFGISTRLSEFYKAQV
jgi:glycosyltransferase involved in cell wall biosynthesis